jgi:2-polyprenyl-3-methyl-5-hydroxy-6-metoxy-1,4-benzoquinol methylase
MVRYRLTGAKIDRNQWHEPSPESQEAYRAMRERTWDELREHNPDYFARLSYSVEHAKGRVLEIGCGQGNMTRWLVQQPEVQSIVAVDAFPQAVEALNALGLEGVECRTMAADALELGANERFDTVMLCEVIEHLYPDEETALLESIRPHLAERARFVVSVPIGWLEDPYHVRAFSLGGFRRHLRRHYGIVEGVDVSSGYSQVAWGIFKGR